MLDSLFHDNDLLELYKDCLISSNTAYVDVLSLISSLSTSNKIADCLPKLRFTIKEITADEVSPKIIERHIQILLLIQFEYGKAYLCHKADEIDFELSDWAGELLERLGVCSASRVDWFNFIQNELVARYAGSHGKTLTQIHLDIGLEPPTCLPDIEGDDTANITDSPVFAKCAPKSPIHKNSKLKELQSPGNIMSPHTARVNARNSLPRALFTDLVVVSSQNTPGLSTSLSCSAFMSSSTRNSSSFSMSLSRNSPKSNRKKSNESSTPAPQLVLIPTVSLKSGLSCTPKTRRKPKTPVKRYLTGGTPSGSGRRRRSSGQQSGNNSAKTQRTSKSRPSTASLLKSSAESPARRIKSSKKKSSKTTSSARFRSVQETPNPKMSHPRWERAKMAAAEKTKNHLVIVAESPVKPSELLGSPLRRLKRASSLICEAGRCLITASTAQNLQSDYINNQQSDSTMSASGMDFGSGSGGIMSRAETWRRRLHEEELSLSQFTEDNTTTLPWGFSSASQPANNLSLRRQSSNLFANLMIKGKASKTGKFALHSISSSPPILRLSSTTCNYMVTNTTPNKTVARVGDFVSSPVVAGSFYVSTPPKQVLFAASSAVLTTPNRLTAIDMTTPTLRIISPVRHVKIDSMSHPCSGRSRGGTHRLPISPPHVYDEEAMFMGQEEFLRNTTPARKNPLSPLASTNQFSGKCTYSVLSAGCFEDSLSPRPSKHAKIGFGNHSLPPKSPNFLMSPTNLSHSPLLSPCKRRCQLSYPMTRAPSIKTPQKGLFGAPPVFNLSSIQRNDAKNEIKKLKTRDINGNFMSPGKKRASLLSKPVVRPPDRILRPRRSLFN